jgi:hypothetical protein
MTIDFKHDIGKLLILGLFGHASSRLQQFKSLLLEEVTSFDGNKGAVPSTLVKLRITFPRNRFLGNKGLRFSGCEALTLRFTQGNRSTTLFRR